jgi:hypothetical protein
MVQMDWHKFASVSSAKVLAIWKELMVQMDWHNLQQLMVQMDWRKVTKVDGTNGLA